MTRIGIGYDLHRLIPDRPLVLGGINIPSDVGCDAHSDGDVVLHALTDAILGALAQGDIGRLFPDSDAEWKDADSSVFVAEAVRRMSDADYVIGNVDITIVLQRPKLAPHHDAMRKRLAELLRCDISRVSTKAKTNETVDAVGRGEAVACQVVVLLVADADSAD